MDGCKLGKFLKSKLRIIIEFAKSNREKRTRKNIDYTGFPLESIIYFVEHRKGK